MLCEYYHCLPWDLDQGDRDRALMVRYAGMVATVLSKKKSGQKTSGEEEQMIGPIFVAEAEEDAEAAKPKG